VIVSLVPPRRAEPVPAPAPRAGAGIEVAPALEERVEPVRDSARDVTFPDDVEVIGVSAGGADRAYLLDTLVATENHVVNDRLERAPVSVTYCDRTNCARAFTGGEDGPPLELRAVGFFAEGGMVLGAGDGRYFQKTGRPVAPGTSAPFPYRELPSVRTTWAEWAGAHPATSVVYYPCLAVGAWQHVYPGRLVSVPPDEPVVGLTINGLHRAYLLRGFRKVFNFVVRDVIDDVWVTVAHDVRGHRTAAFVPTNPDAAAPITFAGWDARSGGMVLAWGGRRYECETGAPRGGADREPFPLRRVPLVSTTWSAWTGAHPDTAVYVGEFGDLVHLDRADEGTWDPLTALSRLLPLVPGCAVLLVLLAHRFARRGRARAACGPAPVTPNPAPGPGPPVGST
jgi:hypothetical protein